MTPPLYSAPDGATTFDQLGIAEDILAVLKRLGLTVPSPIQAQAIPQALQGRDVIGIAQTGTGKTLAFGIPLMEQVRARQAKGLILVPTRELALQVYESLGAFAKPLGFKGAVLIGGAAMGPQLSALRQGADIIIATPGRLIDHLEQGTIKLNQISVLVLDEADRMLDMGFLPQIKKILMGVPKDRQTLLFSATLSREIVTIANTQMRTPMSIEVSPPGTTADKVSQEFFIVRKDEKVRLLEHVLTEHQGPTIVFTRTKHGATRLMKSIKLMGHHAAEIHSNRSLSQRRQALDGFKSGQYRVLVATDIAARGIDVKDIALVVNYDLPGASEDYVHRIGRTARAGTEGHAISFAQPDEKRTIRDIERLIRKDLPLSQLPETLPAHRALPPGSENDERDERPRGGYGGRGGGGGRSNSYGSGGQGRSSFGGGGNAPRSSFGGNRGRPATRGRSR